MGKYDTLRDYLQSENVSEMTLTFAGIERIIGEELPDSARLPQYWENATNRFQQSPANKAARNAGYRSVSNRR